MISLIWASLMPSHQRRSSSRRWGRVGETIADRQDQGRPVTLSSLRPENTPEFNEACRDGMVCGGHCVFIPGSLVSRQLSCLLAMGVQERSREVGCRLIMPARAWLLSGLHRLTSMWLHRRLSQLLHNEGSKYSLLYEQCGALHLQAENKGTVTYHLYQALHTVMQASSSALFKYLKTDTHTSFSPPLSLPTSLKEGSESNDGGEMVEDAEGAAASSSSEEDAERVLAPLSPWLPRRRGL